MARKIFICYRRDDSGMAGRIGDSLGIEFGGDGVFLDTDKLVPGHRFESELLRTLNECDVFIAVIGTQWLPSFEQRQQSDQKDYVVEEIKEALRLNLSVIPLLVDGAELPDESQLPDEVGDAMRWHGHHVRHESFRRDVDELSQAIHAIRGSDKPPKKPIAGLIVGGSLSAALLGGGLWYLQSDGKNADKQTEEIPTGASVDRPVSTQKIDEEQTVSGMQNGEVGVGVSLMKGTQEPAGVVTPQAKTTAPQIAPQTNDASNVVATDSAHQEIKTAEPVASSITATVVSDDIRWTDGFSIFTGDKFNLCGYTSFTASVSDADNVVIIDSSDRRIAGQTFRGLQWRITPGAGTTLFNGCRVLLDYETLSGTQRIRIRENSGE